MRRITIFGAGTMGLGIAQSAIQAGLEVKLFDIFSKNPGMLERAQRKLWLSLFLEKDKNRKLLYQSKEEVDEAFGYATWLENSEEGLHVLKACDAVIEAVFEDEEIKKTLYTKVSKEDFAIPIFTNTSTIQISRLAPGVLINSERFMGVHFFNPVPRMKLVELIPHIGTSEETIKKAQDLAAVLGKKSFLVPDVPGFAVNRIAVPMVVDFAKELAEDNFKKIDVAFVNGAWPNHHPSRRIVENLIKSAEIFFSEDQKNSKIKLSEKDIDELMKLGTAMPVGPFELKKLLESGQAEGVIFKMGPGHFCDLVGIDVAVDCIKSFAKQEPCRGWVIPDILSELVRERRFGQKSGRGFYKYGTSVEVDFYPDYAKITFGDGAGNLLSTELVNKIREVLKSIKEKGRVKAVFIKGAGKNFGFGANVKEFPLCFNDRIFAEEAISAGCHLMDEINEFPCPVIAVIEGRAMGGAYELALACDYIVAKEGSIVQLPEVGLGILPGWGGTQKLPRRAGLSKGLQVIITAQPVYAHPPFVDETVPEVGEEYLADFFDKRLPKLERAGKAKRLFNSLVYSWPERKKFIFALIKSWLVWVLQFRKPPKSFYLAAKAVYDGNKKEIFWGLLEERRVIMDVFKTHDAEEGIRSFLEKREARFKKM